MKSEECKNCKYWSPLVWTKDNSPCLDQIKRRIGRCSRSAPQIVQEAILENRITKTLWPETKEDDSCGQYESKQTETEYWESQYWDQYRFYRCENRNRLAYKKELALFRKWLIEIASPLNGCDKRTPTKKLMAIIKDALLTKK